MRTIDLKDKRILAELEMDARMPITILAKKVGLSRQVIEYRIKRIQTEGILFGAIGVFDSAVVGNYWYRILLRLKKITKEQKNTIIKTILEEKQLFWLGEIGGNWDIALNLVCKDTLEFNKLFEKLMQANNQHIAAYEILIYINVKDESRQYILPTTPRKEFIHMMKYNPEITLDSTDINIIKILTKNAFYSNIEIGSLLHISGNTVKNRIEELKKNNILLGFRLFINPAALGYQSHLLFLELTQINPEQEKKLEHYLKTIPNITFIVKHVGKWRMGLEIETKTEQEFQDIFVDIRGRFQELITGFESMPLFKDYSINYFPEGCFK